MQHKKPRFNIHCHLLNHKFIPDEMTKNLAFGLSEEFLKTDLLKVLARAGGESAGQMLVDYDSEIDQVTERYLERLEDAKLDACVPLMMDLEQSIVNDDVYKPHSDNIDYYYKAFAGSLALSKDNKYLASCSYDGMIKVWRIENSNFTEDVEIKAHNSPINDLTISRYGDYIISASTDSTIKIWHRESGTLLKTLDNHSGSVKTISMSNDGLLGGNYLVSGSVDGVIYVWDLKDKKQLFKLEDNMGLVNCVAISEDGQFVVSGSSDNKVRIWKRDTGELLNTLNGHKHAVKCISITPDNEYIVSGGSDDKVIMWSRKTGEILKAHKYHKNSVRCVSVSSDNSKVITGSFDNTVIVWDWKSGVYETIEGHNDSVIGVVSNSDYIVSGSNDNAVKVWDVNTYNELNILNLSTKIFLNQIDLISQEIAKYPWKIFPFVMFDPRREDSASICIKAIEQKGFIGVKIYPALGYYPDPECYKEDGNYNTIGKELIKIFEYCGINRIPITVHAQPGSAFPVWEKEEACTWNFTEILNWKEPIHKYNLKVNFAHMAGNYIFNEVTEEDLRFSNPTWDDVYLKHQLRKLNQKGKDKIKSEIWREQILDLIIETKTKEIDGMVFTDLSAHKALSSQNEYKDKYFKDLKNLMNQKGPDNSYIFRNRILFGTDASITSISGSEKEYLKEYENTNNLPVDLQEMIITSNPISFLFDEKKVPKNYTNFLIRMSGENEDSFKKSLPPWVDKDKEEYYIV